MPRVTMGRLALHWVTKVRVIRFVRVWIPLIVISLQGWAIPREQIPR